MRIFQTYPTSPVRCSHFTLVNPKVILTALFMHTCEYLLYLRKKHTVTHVSTLHENVTWHTLPCQMQNFLI